MSDGRKEVLTIVPGYRESTGSWTSVLRDLRDKRTERGEVVGGGWARGYLGGTGGDLAGDG